MKPTRLATIALALAGCLFSGITAHGEAPKTPVMSVFEEIPSSVLHLLTPGQRMDMVTYYRNDSIVEMTNQLNGISRIDTVTGDYLKVQITDVSTLEIKTLPLAKPQGQLLAAVSYTIDSDGAPADSELYFYSATADGTGLKPVAKPEKIFRRPAVKDFFEIPKGSATKMKELEALVPYPTIRYSFDPERQELIAQLTVGEYMLEEDYRLVKLFLRPELRYAWTGTAFRPIK